MLYGARRGATDWLHIGHQAYLAYKDLYPYRLTTFHLSYDLIGMVSYRR